MRLIILISICLLISVSMVSCRFAIEHEGVRYGCRVSADCPSGYVCNGVICVSSNNPNDCYRDQDCRNGEICEGGRCITTDGGITDEDSACAGDHACDPGYCLSGVCYEGKKGNPCLRTNQCQAGLVCAKIFDKALCAQRCNNHDDCALDESCRAGFDGGVSLCVKRCNPVEQTGCASGQVCVLNEGRGYCLEKRGKNLVGQLCNQDADCEIHLLCRKVKDYPVVRRCAEICAKLQGCPVLEQNCVLIPPIDSGYGYCEPQPTIVKEGEICGGDLKCPSGLECKDSSDTYQRCQK